jgi:hypothetical protein
VKIRELVVDNDEHAVPNAGRVEHARDITFMINKDISHFGTNYSRELTRVIPAGKRNGQIWAYLVNVTAYGHDH